MALAITDDHAVQEATFCDAPHSQRSPGVLRSQMMREEIDAAGDAQEVGPSTARRRCYERRLWALWLRLPIQVALLVHVDA